MAKYTQANRPMALTTPLGDDALLLTGFTGTEAVSQPFQFHLDLLAESDADVAFDRLLGQAVTVRLSLPNRGQRYFSGIVRRFGQGGPVTAADGKTVFYRYRAEVVPQLWLLTRKVQSRVFQQISVPDILKQVLQQEWKLNVASEIQGDFAARDYCVQYRESDFAFVSRIMEEEGIFYFFTHTANDHQLVLANTPQSHPELPGAAAITYESAAGGLRDEDRIQNWEKYQEVRSGKYTVWDYSFEMPAKNLAADRMIADAVSVGRVTHKLRVAGNEQFEIYQYPGGYAQRFDGVAPSGQDRAGDLQKIFSDNGRTAAIRIQEEAVPGLLVTGESNCRNLVTGHRFALQRHFNADGEYVLTRVEHTANQESGYLAGEEQPFDYHNRFECIPLALPFRPARVTPKPVIAGTQTAVVVGPAGEGVFVDKYGRVKVQFHWDRQGKKDANSSSWLRVAQIWAGKRWGAFFWPRVGQEVVVAFEEGDPDQPLVVGSVYNAELMPPFELPANDLVNGVKSCSAGADSDPGVNFNGLLFYDQPGEEHVQIHSERHETFNTESTKFAHIGASHTQVVGGLGGIGSGQGGGDDDSKPAKLYWEADALGTWAQNLNLTVGVQIENVLGIAGEYVAGSYNEVIINPFGFLAEAGGAGLLATLARGIGALSGALTFVIGADTTMVYGPEVNIHRGAKYEYAGNFDPWYTAGAILVAGITLASSIASGLIPEKAHQYALGFGLTGVYELALALLAGLETLNAKTQAAEKHAFEGEFLAGQIAQLNKLVTYLSGAAERRAIAAAQAAAQAAAGAAAASQSAAAAQAEAVNHTKVYNSHFTISAYDIVLRSAGAPPDAGPGALAAAGGVPGASKIVLDAQGGGATEDGFLLLNATGGAALVCGPAYLTMQRMAAVAEVILEAGPAGQIALHQGLPDVGPTTLIAPQGIKLSVGAPGAGAVVTLTPVMAKIQFAEWYISLTPAGITFSVGENTFTMTPTGIVMAGLSLEFEADAALNISAPMLAQAVDGEASQENALALIE